MIILRKPGKYHSATVIADDLGGAKDGSNQIYTTTYTYKRNRISVLFNGQALQTPEDFIQTGNNVVTLTHVYPDDTDVIRANYELSGSVAAGDDHGGLSGLLDDDHPQYHTNARGDARYYIKPTVDALLAAQDEFTELLDTPTTYSGAASKVVVVKGDQTGLEFVDLGLGVQKKGIENIVNGASSVSVSFATAFSTATYTVTLGLENTVDATPSIYPMIISTKTVSGFTVLFAGDIDSSNYKLNWIARA